MRLQISLIFGLLSAFTPGISTPSTAQTKDLKGKGDESKLLGVWDYVSVQYEGKPFDVGKDAYLEITEKKWIVHRNGKSIESTWQLNSNVTPKALTQVVAISDSKTFSMKSIYRMDGQDKLVLCEMDHPDKPRPKRFRSKAGDGQFMIVLKRRKQKTIFAAGRAR